MRYFLPLSLCTIFLVACASASPMATAIPIATATSSPIPSVTPSATLTPTETLVPTATSTPTLEEAFGHLIPSDYEYLVTTDSFSSAYGPSYKMAIFDSFFTGNTRIVERFDEESNQNIAHTEIQVVLRDSNREIHTLWLSFGSDNFKGNWIDVERGNNFIRKEGVVNDLLKLLSVGANIRFSFFWDTPSNPPGQRWCKDNDPDFCNDYSFVKFFLARSNMEFLRNLRDGQFPEQAVLDETVIPVDGITLVEPAPPPITTWEPLADLSLYDDFSGSNLDRSRWVTANPSTVSPVSYTLNEGVLELQAATKGEAGYFEARMIPLEGRRDLRAFEVQVQVPKRGVGKTAFVAIRISTSLPDGHEWGTQCFLTRITTAQPLFGCELNGDEHFSPSIEVEYNHWYTIRIEIDRTTGAIQYSLDGQPTDTYLPKDASLLVDRPIQTLFAIWINQNTTIEAQIENVKIADR